MATQEKAPAVAAARGGVGFPNYRHDDFTTGRRQLIRSAIKAAIVNLAIRGLLPRRLARWLIRRWGLRHD